MNTTAYPSTPRHTHRHLSEGARSVGTILEYATRNAMPTPYLLDTGVVHHDVSINARGADPGVEARIRAAMALESKTSRLRPANSAPLCGYGTCALDPACTGKCRYREADEALRGHYSDRHTQRQAMPEVNRKRRPSDDTANAISAFQSQARSLAFWLGVTAAVGVCALAYVSLVMEVVN